MTRVENTFETGLADGTIITAANSDDGTAGTALGTQGAAGTIGTDNTITYTSSNVIRGALSLLYDLRAADSSSTTTNLNLGAAAATVSARFYIRILAFPSTANADISRMLTASSSRACGLRLTPAGTMLLVNGTAGTLSTSPTLTIGTVYRVEVWVTPGATTSTGRVGWALYEGHSTTPLHTFSSLAMNANTTGGANRQEVGKIGTPNDTYSYVIDDWVVDDGIGETFVGPSVVQQTGAVQFDGTSAFSVAALGQYLGAMQANVASTVSMAPLAQPRGAVSAAAVSGVSFGPSASASVRADAVSAVSFAPVVAGAGGVSFVATSAVSFAPLAQKRAALQADAVSTVSMAPLARRLGGFAAAGSSGVSFAPLARFLGGGAFAATSSVSFAPVTPPRSARVYFRGELVERAYHRGEQVVIR